MQFARITTRRWMVAVAGTGLFAGAGVTAQRLVETRSERLAIATSYGDLAASFKRGLKDAELNVTTEQHTLELSPDLVALRGGKEFQQKRIASGISDVQWLKRYIVYYDRMHDKYHAAARRPWLVVPPDSPPSE